MHIGSSANKHILKAQYTTLLNFTGISNGMNPNGSFIFDGTFLYGMTGNGGDNNKGTIFKILPDGNGYVKLMDFAGITNGHYPEGSLISDGTFLYGMTYHGGTNNLGVIFKIMPDGNGYSNLLEFSGATNGSYPEGSLIFDGIFLYGMTAAGGANDMGTIFKIKPNGTGYVKLLDFDGTTNGKYPRGALFSDGTFLYGMTNTGGTNDFGTIFKIMPDGTGYSNLLDFAGTTNGRWPSGSLISDGTFLYGMTRLGGTNDRGTIFKIIPNGTGYVKLFDFVGSTNGLYPYGDLIANGNFLYGMTFGGGINSLGTLYKIKTDGTDYLKLLDFIGATNGSNPYGSLISDGNFLYGMTSQGGTSEKGVVFKFGLMTGLDETSSESEFTVYPNPTTGIIRVSMPKAIGINDEQSVSITNILGEVVLSKEMNLVASTTFTIDISNQPAGIYFLKVGNSVEKIIKE